MPSGHILFPFFIPADKFIFSTQIWFSQSCLTLFKKLCDCCPKAI